MTSYINPRTMTRIAALATMGTLAISAQAADEFIVNNRTEDISNQVSGSGSASSFLDPGTHVTHETDLRWSGMVADGQWNSLLTAHCDTPTETSLTLNACRCKNSNDA